MRYDSVHAMRSYNLAPVSTFARLSRLDVLFVSMNLILVLA